MTSSDQYPVIVSLNGQWAFAMDPHDSGVQENWHLLELKDAIRVPGSWEEQGFGDVPTSSLVWGWTKERLYEGPAWYRRRIEIPPNWHGKSIKILLKGVRWRSHIWLDDNSIGDQNALSVPHRYDLTPFVQPGSHHHLTIRVDNRMLYPLSESHIHSAQTATLWGGITGGIELVARSSTAIKQVRTRPNAAARRFDFEVEISQFAPGLVFQVAITNPQTGETISTEITLSGSWAAVQLDLGAEARLWWDDDPFLYEAEFVLRQGETTLDTIRKRLGLREIATQGRRILLNGKPIFLRGYVDCCIFPQTGYPVWDIEHYRRQFHIAKSYGFNHARLHSWTAPEPFWEAADELGMLIQTELPHWSRFYDFSEVEPPEEVQAFLSRELEGIVQALHFHPSWIMLSNGNELIGNTDGHPRLLELTARAKELDPTRLFTDQTGFGQLPAPGRPVDYYVQSCNWHPPKKIYDAATDNSTEDFSAVTARADRPVIGHEHGQFTMYVRPAEAAKYQGALRPTWLDSVLETLDAKQMTDRIDDFIQASGTHIVRTYKENIERARRTRDLAGFQLLDIRDFPGQGHATTGILDVFWDSKGLIDPETFSAFNGASVLLIRALSPTFWLGDSIVVDIEISHFGRAPLAAGILRWELTSQTTATRFEGQIHVPDAPVGEITPLGRLTIPTPVDETAHAWELVVRLGDKQNKWHLWSFPYPPHDQDHCAIGSSLPALRNMLPGADFSDTYAGTALLLERNQSTLGPELKLAISDRLSLRLLQYLYDGGCVWLMPDARQLYAYTRTRYLPPFWSYLHFPDNISSVMGTVIHRHPALGRFPHDGFSDWQWYHLFNDAPAMCLDSIPFITPIVEVIDNFNRAKRLCYAFEARVGEGRLFASTWPFSDPVVAGRPEARFLFQEIISYLRSDAFAPPDKLSVGQLLGVIRLTNGLVIDLE